MSMRKRGASKRRGGQKALQSYEFPGTNPFLTNPGSSWDARRLGELVVVDLALAAWLILRLDTVFMSSRRAGIM